MPTIKEQCEKRIRDLIPPKIKLVEVNGFSCEFQDDLDLQDILLAIEKGKRKGLGTFHISHYGTLMELENPSNNVLYDLSKPFSEQSPELYSFLLEIIK